MENTSNWQELFKAAQAKETEVRLAAQKKLDSEIAKLTLQQKTLNREFWACNSWWTILFSASSEANWELLKEELKVIEAKKQLLRAEFSRDLRNYINRQNEAKSLQELGTITV